MRHRYSKFSFVRDKDDEGQNMLFNRLQDGRSVEISVETRESGTIVSDFKVKRIFCWSNGNCTVLLLPIVLSDGSSYEA